MILMCFCYCRWCYFWGRHLMMLMIIWARYNYCLFHKLQSPFTFYSRYACVHPRKLPFIYTLFCFVSSKVFRLQVIDNNNRWCWRWWWSRRRLAILINDLNHGVSLCVFFLIVHFKRFIENYFGIYNNNWRGHTLRESFNANCTHERV